MSDEFSTQRLPDFPTEGYATMRQRMATDAIMHFCRKVERERSILLYIVCLGRRRWRQMAMKQWRGLPIDHDTLNHIYDYFVLQAGPNPEVQLAVLDTLGQL